MVVIPNNAAHNFDDPAVLPDGRIVCVGTVGEGSAGSTNLHGVILRLLENGEPDSTLAGTGLFYQPTDVRCGYEGLAVLPDGRMLLAGNHDRDLSVERRHADGTLDTSFGSGGISKVSSGMESATATDVHVTLSGNIIACGIRIPEPVSNLLQMATATFSQDGGLMANGVFMAAYNQGTTAAAMVVQPADGRIVLGGTTNLNTGYSRAIVARRTGTSVWDTDTSFNGTGAFIHQVLGMPHSRVTDVALDPQGRILACGWYSPYTSTGGRKGFVMRLLSNGTLDPAFGDAGIATDGLLTGGEEYNSLAVLADGHIAVCGNASFPGNTNDRLIAVLFDTNGMRLDAFGGNGYFAYMAGTYSKGGAVVQQQDGKLVLTGRGHEAGALNLLVIRLGDSDSTTGLDAWPEAEMKDAITILPNPIMDHGFLQLDLIRPERVHIELFDVLGKPVAVLLSDAALDAGRHLRPIPAMDLSPGIYVLVCKSADRSLSTRFIRQ